MNGTRGLDPGRLYGRGIAFPFRLGPDGRVAWSEGPENIRQSIRLILLTEPRERLMLPDFGAGLRRYLFEPNVASTHGLIEAAVTRALERWEPRITLDGVDVDEDPDEPRSARVTVHYRLVADQQSDQLRLTVHLSP